MNDGFQLQSQTEQGETDGTSLTSLDSILEGRILKDLTGLEKREVREADGFVSEDSLWIYGRRGFK